MNEEVISNKSTHRNEAANNVFISLSQHPEIVPYITIDTVQKLLSDDPIKITREVIYKQYDACMARISEFYQDFIKNKMPVKKRLTLKLYQYQFLNHKNRMIYHTLLFLEAMIYEISLSDYQKKAQMFKIILDIIMLYSPEATDLYIILNEDALIKDMKKEPHELIRVKTKYNDLVVLIHKYRSALKSFDVFKFSINQLIHYAKEKANPETNIFSDSFSQFRFEKCILSQYCPLREKYISLIHSYQELDIQLFMTSFYDVINKTLEFLKNPSVLHNAVTITYLFRFVFSQVYLYGNKYFFPIFITENILGKLSNVTIEELELQLDFCPTIDDLKLIPREVFRNDPHFSGAVVVMETIPYKTNPLDILDTVNNAILIIEESCTFYSKEPIQCLPFDVTFGLFLAILLSSDIPEFNSVVQFVDDCTPSSGLCSPLSYAKSNLIAAKCHLTEMLQNHK